MSVEVYMPKMSDHMDVGIIIAWLVKEGDEVIQGQPLLELETDKATVELESPSSGIIKGIRSGVESGASVPVGETLAFIVVSDDEQVPSLPPLSGEHTEEGMVKSEEALKEKVVEVESTSENGGQVRAAPAVRRVAKELGVELQHIKGSGPGGRILESDLHSFIAQQKPEKITDTSPESKPITSFSISPVARRIAEELGVDISQIKPSTVPDRITKEDIIAYAASQPSSKPEKVSEETKEWVDLSRIQLITGQRMVESVQTAPQFALTTTVDMTRGLELRDIVSPKIESNIGIRPSITSILIKIVADALKYYPRANASFVDGKIQIHSEINIGVAVGTEEGLVVPVIHNADQKNLTEITLEIKSLQEKAANMRFSVDDLSGGTFTVSNLGMFGIDHFHAIINPPESAILAVGRIIKQPTGMPDNSIALRPIMNLTLSIDHRSLDGMQGAKFLSLIKERLEEPYLLF